MDYAQILEKYVLEAWERGETTPAIKSQLAAKRWPMEMVDVVVDELVKKRVAQQEGEKKAVAGPDLWSQPTWPQANEGWSAPAGASAGISVRLANSSVLKTSHKRKFSAMIQENSGASATGANVRIQPPAANATETLKAQEQILVEPPASLPDPQSVDMPADAQIRAAQDQINQELDKVLTTLTQTLPQSAESELQTAINEPKPSEPVVVQKMTTDSVVEKLQAQEEKGKKLPQKLQESRNLRSEDEKIQLRSLIFLGLLFSVIILALIWHFFVIK